MTSRAVGPVQLIFTRDETETGDIIVGAVEPALQTAQELWGLVPPQDCRVYVMTSWLGFFLGSAPWTWRVLLTATLPFWSLRAARTWPYSAAWTQRYGRRTAIGVKPPRLLAQSDRSIGMRVFVEESDPAVSVRHVTCHELVHACSAHLRLPAWLNEGIATVAVDRVLGKRTVRGETLAMVRGFQPKGSPPSYRQLSRMRLDAIAYHAVRGYWIVQYLEAVRPGLLRRLFSRSLRGTRIEDAIVAEVGYSSTVIWRDIDGIVADHFADDLGRRDAPSGLHRAAVDRG